MSTLTIIGAVNQEELTRGAENALRGADLVMLRTGRHPLAAFLTREGIGFQTLDELYEQSEDFDAFNRAAASRVLSLAQNGRVCYAVSDVTLDNTVAALYSMKPENLTVTALPGVGCAARCLTLLCVKDTNVRICAAEAFAEARVSPDEPLLLCELHSRECAGLCKLRLATLLPDETPVILITGDAATGALCRTTVPLFELDRQSAYDHMTAAYIPAVAMEARTRYDMDDLVHIIARLRAPDGCPWDREQTHESLLSNLLEESYEFIQAVRDQDTNHMYDELGDVLLQIVLHAEIARQHGDFDILDVTSAESAKMIERHPHIFGSVKADTAEEVLTNWEDIKRKQRGLQTIAQAMEDVTTGLSPLMRASKVQHKAAKVGFDFDSAKAALAKVYEEADEVAQNLDSGTDPESELGDLFFSVVNVCRLCGKNPDIALHFAVNKFISRFRQMENMINMSGKAIKDLTLSEMDVYWEAGKREDKRD